MTLSSTTGVAIVRMVQAHHHFSFGGGYISTVFYAALSALSMVLILDTVQIGFSWKPAGTQMMDVILLIPIR